MNTTRLADFLDLGWLKTHSKLIHFFGLGFVQIKLNDLERLHFYHPDFKGFVEEPHDHRYYFTSNVLKGSIKNTIWKIADIGEPAIVKYESCKKEKNTVPNSYETHRECIGSFIINEGSGYFIDDNTFHQVCRQGNKPCITYLVRGKPTKDFARVLSAPSMIELCPFSQNLPDDELWKIVKECLDD